MRREFTALFLVFMAVLLLGSLASFHPEDPSIIRSVGDTPVYNHFGIVGAWISGFLLGCFGAGSFWLPVLIGETTWRVLRKKEHPFSPGVRAAGGFLLILATGAILSGSFVPQGRFAVNSLVGGLLRDLLEHYVKEQGALLVLAFLFVAGFMVATGLSLGRVLAGLARLWVWGVRLFFAGIRALWLCVLRFCSLLKGLVLWLGQRFSLRKNAPVSSAGSLPVSVVPPPMPPKEVGGRKETPVITSRMPVKLKSRPCPVQEELPVTRSEGVFRLPPLDLLEKVPESSSPVDEDFLRSQSEILEKKLADFGVDGRVVTVTPGPVITTFEYKPAPGVKISKVTNLADDLALALKAMSIRIIAPIPGKAAIGIEVPNAVREMVHFREIVVSESFRKSKSPLTVCLGKDIVGLPVAVEMDRMPHLLIAGATGAGKSVGLNVMITSLLFKASPEEVKLIMIDPKRIELSVYDGIPHLITPVVTDMKKATAALFWAVKEMERRYELLAGLRCRNIGQYNEKVRAVREDPGKLPNEPEEDCLPEKLPYIVIVIDELADLMMVASKDVEVALARLAQMARAAGIHIILATQRPSVDVLTGIIKANFPTRMAFQVSSRIDSRTILDTSGAEALLGNGDMLFMPPGTARLQRIHGAYIGEDALMGVIAFLKEQGEPEYLSEVTEAFAGNGDGDSEGGGGDHDARYDEAVALVARNRQASISMVQRHLRIGYNRAARIIEAMEQEGVIGPADGAKPREVLVPAFDEIP
ncbi:DNA translocase FtsK 4TM domain-containing protein [Desulfobotulus sp. H1]|uniref:DNA translocase FtsK 4TM domain-containing protein n=1 Tax=Desulfobotulus pelophilus TaxID=2823377 RepID=A0ABT3N6G4_9BACT|nr:DNA translocase FtsK [Desulfobotulus pelophilus]MCW7753048.1 DNA translocase FtsK 4TM domain-containing protein [Desulfobotulus pelophilus]